MSEHGDGVPPTPGEDPSAQDRPDEQELWRSIVANYGDRATLDDEPAAERPPPPPAVHDDPGHSGEEDGGHYVPPTAPAVVLPRGARLVAWGGVLGVPVLLLLGVFVTWDVPDVIVFLGAVWLVGGFAYLVATMRSGPPDDWSDGAVL